MALFGDPRRDNGNVALPFGPLPFPAGCAGDPPPWIRGNARCFTPGGFFGARKPYVPADIELRVGSWCREWDSVCEGWPYPDWETHHEAYFDEGAESFIASREAADALGQFLPEHTTAFDTSWYSSALGTGGAELAIVIDTTGSMWWALDDAKASATELAEAWLASLPNGRVALAQYRDHGDSFVARVELQLSNDVAAFQAAVDALEADEGGDIPEAVYSGIMTTLNELDWRSGATKAMVVIADAPGKDPEPVTGYTQADVVNRALEIDPVALYALNVAEWSEVTDFFVPLAEQTAGAVLELQPGQTLSDALFEVLDVISLSPVAFLNGPYIAETGTPITFRAYPAFDPDGEIVSYEWDFDGDGMVDLTTTVPEVEYTYPGEFDGLVVLRVVSSDGGTALASAEVRVDSVGLADDYPLPPSSAEAAVTGPGEVTVSWTPAADDRADGYRVYFADGTLAGHVFANDPHSLTMDQLDLSEPVSFIVASSNEYGLSAGVETGPVGGLGPETTELVSISTTRSKGNGASLDAYISADGRYVVYHSDASNLDPADTNNLRDVFVHDRVNQTTTLVSASAEGIVGDGHSQDPAISKDGRYVAFRSQANNLVAGDTNGTAWDIFVKELATGAIERVSVSSSGEQQNGASRNAVLSADGRFVAFRSAASNLVAGDTNGLPDVFVRDRQAGTTSRISVASDGSQADALSDEPAISDDGRYVVFISAATNLVADDTNGLADVFRHDTPTGSTIRVSVSTSGAQADGASDDPALNGDGNLVAWESTATNLVAGDTNAKQDIFVRDIAAGTTIRVSLASDGTQATKNSEDPSLSTDGTKLAFNSTATNLVAGDTNSRNDVFLHDLLTGETVRKSLTAAGEQANDASSEPWLSGDGTAIAFQSVATNLVPEDTDSITDIYVRGPSLSQ